MRYCEGWRKTNPTSCGLTSSVVGQRRGSGLDYVAYRCEHPKAFALRRKRNGELHSCCAVRTVYRGIRPEMWGGI